MTTYLLTIQQPATGAPEPEVLEAIGRDLQAFHDDLRAAGAFVFAGGLDLAGPVSVAVPGDGDVTTTDGPYAEDRELVGGICVLTAPDLAAAQEWARRAALATTLPVELRPFHG